MAKTGANKLRDWSLTFEGEDYQWGEVPEPFDAHNDGDPRDGDCSGACYAWWRQGGVPNKVLGGRQTANAYARKGKAISARDAVCGDYIVLLENNGRAHHIIMCIGKGDTMEAMGEKYGYVRSTVAKSMKRSGAHAKRMPKIHDYLGNLTGSPSTAKRPSHPQWPNRYLHVGLRDKDRRGAIRMFQQKLEDRRWLHIVVNGRFDEHTKKIVKQFQDQKGLEVDGIVGPLTWNAFWEAPITKG